MDDRTTELLTKVLDMNEDEMRASLIEIVNGKEFGGAIDGAYNEIRRTGIKELVTCEESDEDLGLLIQIPCLTRQNDGENGGDCDRSHFYAEENGPYICGERRGP